MKPRVNDVWRVRSLQLLALAVVFVGFLQWSGLADRSFGWIHDALMRSGPTSQTGAAVVLLESQGGPIGDEEMTVAIGELRRLGAAQVVVSINTPDISPRLRAAMDAAAIPITLSGGGAISDAAKTDGTTARALSVAPPSESGVARRQFVSAKGQAALEFAAAQQRLGDLGQQGDTYAVNFSAGHGYLPRANLELALKGMLIEELVRGRSVLVGLGDQQVGIHTPLGEPAMSLLEFQGWALDSLLQKRTVTWLGTPTTALLLLLIALPSAAIYIWSTLRVAVFVSAVLIVSYVGIAWVCLHLLEVWLPLPAMCLLQLVLLLGIFRLKENQREHALRELLVSSSVKLRERVVPVSFFSKKDPWTDVIAMVNQVLGLDRMIFLDRVEDDHRVREIAAYRCSLGDIGEKRRDYQRTPYSTAIELKGPLQLELRYLKEAGIADEVQFLVPLVFAGQILGFWAFGVRRARMDECVGFAAIARDFGEQIAELLYHRKLHREREADRNGGGALIVRTLGLRSGTSSHELLTPVLDLLGRRQDTLERVVNGLSTAFGLYDLFGHAVHVNGAMEAFARTSGLKLYDSSALDVIGALTGAAEDVARGYILTALTERHEVIVPVSLGADGHAHLLRIQALEPDERVAVGGVQPAAPFRTLGLLLELRDISDVGEALERSRALLESMFARLDQDLQVIERASASGGSAVDGATLVDVSRHVCDARDSVAETVRLVREVSMPGAASSRVVPVDLARALQRAQSRHVDTLAARRLSLSLFSERVVALADDSSLTRVLQYLIEALIEDAADGTAIEAEAEQVETASSHVVQIALSNTGFGIPDERVQFLLQNDTGQDNALDRLAECRRLCESWGGRLTGVGVMGSGLRFQIELSSVSATS